MIQSRIAALVASFSVRVPVSTGSTDAPRSRIRSTFGACRRMSSEPMYTTHSSPNRAHAVAVATPCWPAPVSAMIRRLPSRRARTTWPRALLILWAPVWFRSSRLRYSRLPGANRSARVMGDGRPTYVRPSSSSSARNAASCFASSQAAVSSSSAGIRVSGTYRPPYSPYSP